jgi:hypothetical protein
VRQTRAQVDGAADGRSSGAVDVGGAEVDVDLLDQLWVDLLVREDGVIARIVQLDAVEGQADAVGREAADGQRAAGRTIGIVVLEADARHGIDGVEDRLTRVLAADIFLGEDRFGLGRIRRLDAADLLGARSGDDDFLLEFLGTGRLGKSGGRQDNSRRAEKNKLFHVEPPTGKRPKIDSR